MNFIFNHNYIISLYIIPKNILKLLLLFHNLLKSISKLLIYFFEYRVYYKNCSLCVQFNIILTYLLLLSSLLTVTIIFKQFKIER